MTDNKYREHLTTVRTLSEALPYMRRFSGQTFVIKYGGHAMGNRRLAAKYASDVVLMKQVGINPVIVHGGGPQIGSMLERLKIKSSFIDGLRVTDRETVEIVEMVLSGSINKQVVSAVNEAGATAIGLSGKDGGLIKARKVERPRRAIDSSIEEALDLGFVGEPEHVNPQLIYRLLNADILPIIAPIGVGPSGETFNINADTAAGAIAATLKAVKLIMLTDITGVLDEKGELVRTISLDRARELISNGTVKGGMIPKLETCLSAVAGGAQTATILDGRLEHVLLLETFTAAGVGTMISLE